MKYILSSILGLLLGVANGYIVVSSPRYTIAEERFEEVRRFVEYGSFALNQKDEAAGLRNNTRKLEFHLHRLEEMREINGIDLVLPSVPYTRDVVDFIQNYDLTAIGVVWASMNPQYVAFPLSGELPLHIEI